MEKFEFKQTNLEYDIDFDYDRSCCHCNDSICRCTTIENTTINKIDVDHIIDELYERHSRTDSPIDLYCFNRICYKFGIYDKDNYWIETCGGYYGEEIKGVWFENEEQVYDAYYNVLACETDAEKIQYILELEYGYLTEAIQNITVAELIETNPSNISPPQLEYLKKVDKDVIESYRDWKHPIGVCIRDNERYKLIDGYHRFVANKDRYTVDVVVVE